MLREEPRTVKSMTEIAEPARVNDRIEMEEPMLTKLIVDKTDPDFNMVLSDKLDPRSTAPSRLTLELPFNDIRCFEAACIETDDPTLVNDLKDRVDPRTA
jgi:hypothetical protein